MLSVDVLSTNLEVHMRFDGLSSSRFLVVGLWFDVEKGTPDLIPRLVLAYSQQISHVVFSLYLYSI